MLAWLKSPIGFESRESLRIVIIGRWAILAGVLFFVDYPLRSDARGFFVVGGLWLGAVSLNLVLEWLLHVNRPVAAWLPLGMGIYDVAAITGEIALIDGFDNATFVLYYPALLAVAALFPGRIALSYAAAIIAGYGVLSVTVYERFDARTGTDWHDLGFRLGTMAAAAFMAYLLVRVERIRRMRAVAAEAARQREVLALEERAHELERAAEEERRRLLRDVHDGISQGIYVLTLGLESAAHQAAARGDSRPADVERMEALLRLSRQTLLEARGLVFDLGSVTGGDARLDDLLRHQAEEFRAVTGIAATVNIRANAGVLPAATVTNVYRVIQESLANVFRHSGATCVRFDLDAGEESITLSITDNGCGFGALADGHQGHGLRLMAERAERIGGSLSVERAPGQGTAVALTIPRAADGR